MLLNSMYAWKSSLWKANKNEEEEYYKENIDLLAESGENSKEYIRF